MKKITLIIVFAIMLALPFLAFAQLEIGDSELPETDPEEMINTIANIAFGIIVIVAVAMIIFAAFQFITAGGDATKVQTGRNVLLYAIIGLVIAIAARGLVAWVLGQFV